MNISADDFKGRTAIVTGGSRGIGRAITWELASRGADVLVVSRKQATLDALTAEAAEAGLPGRLEGFAANVGDPDAAVAAAARAMDSFGSIDFLVNNAATNPYYGDLVDLDHARAAKIVQVNQFGLVAWVSAAWKAWMSDHDGSVVNVSSVGGYGVDRGIGYYNATKAAVIHLTRQLSVELAPHVRVNSVAPGVVRTEMSRALWEGREAELEAAIPLQRFGEPEDIADAVMFMLGSGSQWLTGQTLVVDGGAANAPKMVPALVDREPNSG
ncbi:SDR family oxidoreductase [Nocardioides marmoriginsengisoli]|uniref:SDR family oxidoreductase n=1 Tax=Nocardioides marmoriginsengisoli TaxID=661483 RepID=A0A3N0CHY2_9ACTN|nr:SDR family oxidoreductase [Nocardioides marmoriginsengisoli]RNL62891.1 SDR family oxidoreductase [Nocardioides marmoriginsengisoli]